MTDDPKQRALDRLLAMVDKACDVVSTSLTSERVPRGQATRSADAWRVLDAVLKSEPDQTQPGAGRVELVDAAQFRERAAALSLAYQAKRAPEPEPQDDDN